MTLSGPDWSNGSRYRKPSSTLRQGSSSTIRDMSPIRGRNPCPPATANSAPRKATQAGASRVSDSTRFSTTRTCNKLPRVYQ